MTVTVDMPGPNRKSLISKLAVDKEPHRNWKFLYVIFSTTLAIVACRRLLWSWPDVNYATTVNKLDDYTICKGEAVQIIAAKKFVQQN